MECQQLADYAAPPMIGVESSEGMLRWIRSHSFAAVWQLAGWGLPIGELFDLEHLSRACRRRGRWSFFFSSVPLKVPGGVASPPNGMAIL
ncbi:hypothetical protein NUU61_008409 [Penicillium alfredii]|uniref:Uncharacterized protein n=1 Tax=Penicillium alfredii TaxID=1506179 RepID=A0A9W9ESC4_9EURO|nr:uncharacterized protein NUU61_008409 [Penicillium alfredii]KAJ5087102.1 hypothetical protein NUU61_008409 [Penicillium alfredii]